MNTKKMFTLMLITALLAEFLLTLYSLSGFPPQNFAIVGVVARSSSGSPEIYPGSKRVGLRVETMYMGDESAYSVVAYLASPSGIYFSAGSSSSAPAKSFDGTIVSGVKKGDHVLFEWYLDISKELRPTTYPLYLNITYRSNSVVLSEEYLVEIEVSSYPEAQLSFVEAYLNPAAYPGSVGTDLYVVLENSGESGIVSGILTIELPHGFIISNPRVSVGAVNSGDRFTVRFSDILVPQDAATGTYGALIYMDLLMRTQDNVYYNSMVQIPIEFEVSGVLKEDPIIVSSVSVIYQGSPAPLLPSAKGIMIRVTFTNRLPETVGSMAVAPRPPSGIKIRSLSGTYTNGMPPGGSCFLDMVVDVDEGVKPGLIDIPLDVSYVRIVSDSSFIGKQSISVGVIIESPHAYLPELSLVSAYWGSPNPSPAYAGSRYTPLTLRLMNGGRYRVTGVSIETSSKYLRPIKSCEALAARLLPGSYSEVTFYFDVGMVSGEIPLDVRIKYIFDEFGAHLESLKEITIYLPVEEYPAAASYLEVVSYGWQNNYNVFPRTENASFQVVIANRAPFPVSGIILYLNLPENISSRGERAAKAYIDGPIRSLSTFTASFFPITVGEIKPGRYGAELVADFILQSGGPGVRRVEKFSIEIGVNDDKEAVEFINAGWYEGSVGPNAYGAQLIMCIRNNLVDTMRGVILEISLPRGFINAVDNSSLVRVPPSMAQLPALPQLQPPEMSTLIREYLRIYQSQGGQVQAYSKGDILTFIVSLHVLDVDLGIYNFVGNLSYIDQWGTRRSVSLMIPVAVLGRTGYVGVKMNSTISVRSRFAETILIIENYGTTPLYDVYLVVSPYQGMPLLIASPSVTYIEKIDAGRKIDVPLTLAYNPFGYMTQAGGTTVITYGPAPLIASIIYKDASGAIKRFNNTVTVIVEPFIDLLVRDIRATGKHSSSTISGVIANFGSATAYRVKATFSIGNVSAWTLIGDIAPADEMAFKIEVPGYGEAGALTIEYYDAFNQRLSKEITVRVEPQPEAPATPPQERGLGIETWIVVGAVIAFLAIAFTLIYRVLRARSLK